MLFVGRTSPFDLLVVLLFTFFDHVRQLRRHFALNAGSQELYTLNATRKKKKKQELRIGQVIGIYTYQSFIHLPDLLYLCFLRATGVRFALAVEQRAFCRVLPTGSARAVINFRRGSEAAQPICISRKSRRRRLRNGW